MTFAARRHGKENILVITVLGGESIQRVLFPLHNFVAYRKAKENTSVF